MTNAIFQLIIIGNVIKVEFKITTADGFNKLTEKIIETEAGYEQFKSELLFGIESLDDIMKQALRLRSGEDKNNNNNNNNNNGHTTNGHTTGNGGHVQKVGHQHAPVQ